MDLNLNLEQKKLWRAPGIKPRPSFVLVQLLGHCTTDLDKIREVLIMGRTVYLFLLKVSSNLGEGGGGPLAPTFWSNATTFMHFLTSECILSCNKIEIHIFISFNNQTWINVTFLMPKYSPISNIEESVMANVIFICSSLCYT